jgi:hypothetical protein
VIEARPLPVETSVALTVMPSARPPFTMGLTVGLVTSSVGSLVSTCTVCCELSAAAGTL